MQETAPMRPFEGIRVIDVTHVLAGPFATYQLAVLGADVIKVEHPDDPDQSRGVGSDKELNRRAMGTSFLTQASNKRAITLDLKREQDREILKKLVATADVFVENYRPGAFEALGLGYEALAAINPRLIYASFSAFGQEGPRGVQTAYDHVIQATSGIMAMTGTKDVHPAKLGMVMLGASNLRQQKWLWTVLGRPDMIKKTNDERDADHAREVALLTEIMATRSAGEWEEFLQARHVPAARVRTMGEALADPQLSSRGIIHRHGAGGAIGGEPVVPVAAFRFAHGGPRIDTPPPRLGQHNDEIFTELGERARGPSDAVNAH